MRQWFDSPGQPWQPLVLTNPSLDLAVAWGAAYFAWLRHTGGKRIGGGIARSYYVGVDRRDAADEADADDASASSASCRSIWKKAQEIALDEAGAGAGARPAGDVSAVHLDGARRRQAGRRAAASRRSSSCNCRRCTPSCAAASAAAPSSVPVTLAAQLHRDRHAGAVLRRQGRQQPLAAGVQRPRHRQGRGRAEERRRSRRRTAVVTDVWPEDQVQAAARLDPRDLSATMPTSRAPQELTKALEAALDASRDRLADRACAAGCGTSSPRSPTSAAASPAHLSRWYNLVGYLPAARLRRPARPLPRRAALEADARPAARPARRRPLPPARKAAPTSGSCGGASPAG